jgi:sulfoxide reductase heme-binding subunit YedZ
MQRRPPAGGPANRALSHGAAKPVAFVLACLPFAWLVFAAFADRLGANPFAG